MAMAADRVKSPQDLIDRLHWISSGNTDLLTSEAIYRKAFIRYLKGSGIPRHPTVAKLELTDAEKSIDQDDPLVRSLMFLMYATGTLLLPASGDVIDVRLHPVIPVSNSLIRSHMTDGLRRKV